MIDQKHVAKKIRLRLEARLAQMLSVDPRDLPRIRIGHLINTIFLLSMDEEIGAFHGTFRTVLDLIGPELVWNDLAEEEKNEAQEPEKVTVN